MSKIQVGWKETKPAKKEFLCPICRAAMRYEETTDLFICPAGCGEFSPKRDKPQDFRPVLGVGPIKRSSKGSSGRKRKKKPTFSKKYLEC